MHRGIPFRWGNRLSREFYDRDPPRVAQELVGRILARRYDGSYRLGRITETEAYLGFDDPASLWVAAASRLERLASGGPPGSPTFSSPMGCICASTLSLSQTNRMGGF